MSTKDLEHKLADAAAEVFGRNQVILTLRQSLKERDALIRQFFSALVSLSNEAAGWDEQGLAEAGGWTNTRCLQRRVSEARTAISIVGPLLDAQTPDAAEATR